tara:strand:+ start:430 stop:723 length:294 start_codon:yes stop_codon:yes gene_type:complete
MSVSRYDQDLTVRNGKLLGTNTGITRLRDAINAGAVSTTSRILVSSERLDIVAHRQYGDARLWWVIAAASGIGWWLQAPPGTRLVIPLDMAEVEAVL